MNIQHLRYITEVERTGSISKAAANLFMGQPNLSKAVRELEEEVGITIFRRTAKGVETTEKGGEFLRYARNILAQMDEMENFYKNAREDRVRFQVSVPRASYIAYAFTKFVQKQDAKKEMALRFNETNSMEAISNLLDNQCNLAIIRYPLVYEPYFLSLLGEKGLKHKLLWEFSYVLLMSKKHPLAEKKEITKEELSSYVEVLHGDLAVPSLSPAYLRRKEENPKEHPRRIHVYERGSQFELLEGVPSTYMWVTPIPREILKRYSLVERECVNGNKKHRDVLVYSEHYTLTELDRAFIEKVEEVRDQVKNK